jgi:uncharacterized protein
MMLRLLLTLALTACLSYEAHAQTLAKTPCAVGVYQGHGGGFLIIVERPDTAQTGEWRYAFRNGEFGGTNSN